jgi:hypothetical protein
VRACDVQDPKVVEDVFTGHAAVHAFDLVLAGGGSRLKIEKSSLN